MLVDKQPIETYIFNSLLEYGFAPAREEIYALSDIFIQLLFDMGLEIEEDDSDEFRRL